MKHSTPDARHTKMLVNLRFVGRPYKDPHTFTCVASARTPVAAACRGHSASNAGACDCVRLVNQERTVMWPRPHEHVASRDASGTRVAGEPSTSVMPLWTRRCTPTTLLSR